MKNCQSPMIYQQGFSACSQPPVYEQAIFHIVDKTKFHLSRLNNNINSSVYSLPFFIFITGNGSSLAIADHLNPGW